MRPRSRVIGLVVIAAWTLIAAGPMGVARYGPVENLQRLSTGTFANPIWAGYAVGAGGPFHYVSAKWAPPTVSCAAGETSYSAYWVGLDGYNSRTVEQIGTDSDCVNGTATYYAWYELYPKKGAVVPVPVATTDTMTAWVSYAGGLFSLHIDNGVGGHFDITASAKSAQRSSAEVIVEAPSSNHGPRSALPLANFGSVSFTGATVNDGTLGASSPDELIMETATGTVKATPNDSLSGGNFTVTWGHA